MNFSERFNKKNIEDLAFFIVISISALLFALLAADILSLSFYKKYSLHVPPVIRREVTEVKTLPQYVSSITPIFRSSESSSSQAQPAQTAALPADLDLKATFVGDTASFAVVASGGEDKILFAGDSVSSFHVLEIDADKVVFGVAGKEDKKILRMKYGFSFDEPSPQTQPSDSSAQTAVTSSSQLQKDVSKREFVAMLDPPDRIAKEVALAPVSRDGNPYGIQMTFVKPGSLIQQMGFMPGDILLSMNNKQLLTPEDGMIAYQTMKNEDSVDFKIERGGNTLNLQITFR